MWGTYKGHVRNTSKRDGTIAKAYVVDEALKFFLRYIRDMNTQFDRSERNWDQLISGGEHQSHIFKDRVRLTRAHKIEMLKDQREMLHWYIPNNCRDNTIQGYLM